MNRLETEANNGHIHTSGEIMALATICANILRYLYDNVLRPSARVREDRCLTDKARGCMLESLANFDIAYQEARESAYGATNEDIAYWTLRYASCYRSVIRLLR